jgi:hypothetical protein
MTLLLVGYGRERKQFLKISVSGELIQRVKRIMAVGRGVFSARCIVRLLVREVDGWPRM